MLTFINLKSLTVSIDCMHRDRNSETLYKPELIKESPFSYAPKTIEW
jgi:hypothetical protein